METTQPRPDVIQNPILSNLPSPEIVNTPSGEQALVYEYNSARLAFGLEQDDVPEGVSNISRKPQEHMEGLGAQSEQEAATNYAMALIGLFESPGNEADEHAKYNHVGTEVDFLIHGAENGEEQAAKTLQQLITQGKEVAKARPGQISARIGEHAEQYAELGLSNLQPFLRNIMQHRYQTNPDARMTTEQEDAFLSRFSTVDSVIKEFGQEIIDGLVLVHATKYPPTVTDKGVELRPTEDFGLTDNEGNTVNYPRSSIHFTLNHMVQSHYGGSWEESPYLIVTPLRGVLEHNPGSLDNFNSVDTYLVPPVGEALILPDSQILEPKPSESISKQLSEEMEKRGLKEFTGGSHYGNPMDQAVTTVLSIMFGVENPVHPSSAASRVEQVLGSAVSQGRQLDHNATAEILDRLKELNPNQAGRVVAWGALSGYAKPKFVDGFSEW